MVQSFDNAHIELCRFRRGFPGTFGLVIAGLVSRDMTHVAGLSHSPMQIIIFGIKLLADRDERRATSLRNSTAFNPAKAKSMSLGDAPFTQEEISFEKELPVVEEL